MKFHLYKHRNPAHVKVPLATPEIIEFHETTTTPFSVKHHGTDEVSAINSSSSSPPMGHPVGEESITDSSIDSLSDEHLKNQQQQLHSSSVTQSPENVVTLQRKVSDRKSKRVRAKQSVPNGSGSSLEASKKSMINTFFSC